MLKALWKALDDGLVDNDEKVASYKKHTQFKTRVQKLYPIYDQNGWKPYALSLYGPYAFYNKKIKVCRDRTYIYDIHNGVHPRPGLLPVICSVCDANCSFLTAGGRRSHCCCLLLEKRRPWFVVGEKTPLVQLLQESTAHSPESGIFPDWP